MFNLKNERTNMHYLDKANEIRKKRTQQNKIKLNKLIGSAQEKTPTWQELSTLITINMLPGQQIDFKQICVICNILDDQTKYERYAEKINKWLHKQNLHLQKRKNICTLINRKKEKNV